MKIADASLQMSSSHTRMEDHQIRESLRMWVGNQRPDFEGNGRPRLSAPPPEPVQLSNAGLAAQASEANAIEEAIDAAENDPILTLIRALIALLTGAEVKIFDPSELTPKTASPDTPQAPPPDAAATEAARRPAGFGIEYDRQESYTEVEQTQFEASGLVRTADGKEISFTLSLAMARSYHEESSVSIRLGDAVQKKDPLVINFGGSAAQLTDRRFSFDLDADGQADNIHFVSGGSGFLAFDRNGDGKINDGSELFGARSGNGFAELAALDGDNNGWIDENDAAYSQLRVWTKDGSGQDHLRSLQAADVGAIALAHVATPFDLTDESNNLQGQVRASGVYLHESGGAGTIQQIDLVV